MEGDSTKTSLGWKNGIRANGTQVCLQIIAGHLSGNIRISPTNIYHEGTNFNC
jgi:hypothetical protein